MYNELNNTRAACDQLTREKVNRTKKSSICFLVNVPLRVRFMIFFPRKNEKQAVSKISMTHPPEKVS